MRASTQACASSGLVRVGTGRPYSVPWPPGAVARKPALSRSARPGAPVFACSSRWERANRGSVNMSSSVVTPKTAARVRAALQVCVWPSMRPGSSVSPEPSITSAPAGTATLGPAARIVRPSTTTVPSGITLEPSKMRTWVMAMGFATSAVRLPVINRARSRVGRILYRIMAASFLSGCPATSTVSPYPEGAGSHESHEREVMIVMPSALSVRPEGIAAAGDLAKESEFQRGPQTSDLCLRRFGALAFCLGALEFGLGALEFGLGALEFGLGALAFRLGVLLGCRYQGPVGTEEPDPVGRTSVHDTMPDAEGHPELLAPEPSVLVGRDRLVEPVRQTQPFHLPGLRVAQEVLRRAEDPGVEVPLLGAVLLRGGGREQLDDEVRQPPSLLPGDPDLALAVRVDAAQPEDVRSTKGPPRQSLRHLLRDRPCLLHGVVHEHVAAGIEVGPSAFRHDLPDQLPQQRILQSMPLGLQRLSVVVDELEGQRRERDGWLAHGALPCGVVRCEDLIPHGR